jgi:shikimate dehydrogenase
MTQLAITGITGTTRLIVAMGDPVAQVRFPEVFNKLCEERGIDAVSVPMHITAAGLEGAMRGFRAMENLIGLSVTIPHKGPIASYLDELSERARRVGVVNAVRREPDGRMVGDIFDGTGFVGGLRRQDINVAGANIWQIGAGGAGTAVAFALLEAGAAQLTILDFDQGRAAALVARLNKFWPGKVTIGSPDTTAIDIAINVTPMGLRAEDPLSFDPTKLRPSTIVADVIMKPATTRLLEAAEAHGCRIHRGHHMLDHQVELYADFLGLRAT